ncbi:TetR/AcrR family transcriptional regulator [Kibdelosporangium philippinense]|uniref:TetR/AcrR family transcriptional regulator n=1 Tax=Kibdelosporangium philippinense TaxID=211113 RepID=A0ABS8ZT06_9PSEU|nr:TetR/AcrR family transcriptional regulator [Kibdelosporangium philippinense]MCE7009573.1 TetR/AcrR family transcriptional regulator [Kibdelosporangium philippinense]
MEHVFGDQTGVVELLWGLKEPPSRGPKPTLSVERIARVAMGIADSEGLAAVSMQRVASELEFTKMALYRYVSGKSDLLAVMIELAVGDPPDLYEVSGGWRGRLNEFTRQLAVVWHQHPWLPWATLGDRPIGPRELGWIESAVSALSDTGLTGTEQLDAVFILFGLIRNTQSMSTAGTQPWDSDKKVTPLMQELLYRYGDRFPALTAATSSVTGASRDNGREFGVRRYLDGLEALINQRASAGVHPEADRRPA